VLQHISVVHNTAGIGIPDMRSPFRATPVDYTKTKWKKNPFMQGELCA